MYKLNESNEIKNIIKPLLDTCDEVYIAVAFITNQGFKELFDNNSAKKKYKIITTFEQYITDPIILEYFMKNFGEIHVFDPITNKKSFHSKFIIGLKNNKIKINIVGSMNLTKKSLTNKFETIEFSTESNQSLISDFNYLKKFSEPLTIEKFESYKDRFNRRKFLSFEFEKLERKIGISPRGMQSAVLGELSNLRKNGEEKALLYSSMGTGKTYLSAFDLQTISFKKALFIVHNRLIIRNVKRDYLNVFLDKKLLELYTWNEKLVKNNDIIFSTQNTIKSIMQKNSKFLEKFDYFIFDEAHRIGEGNIQNFLFENIQKLKHKKFILGMTATPWRNDNPQYLFKIFENNIVGKIDLERALNEKLVCGFRYKAIGASDINFDVDKLDRKNLRELLSKFMNTLENVSVWDRTKVKGIIFTANISEANMISKLINENYLKYKSLPFHSKINSLNEETEVENDVDVLIKMLEDDCDPLNFIVAVDKFNEGVDISRINTIGMFRFTKSSIIYSQQIGRGLRLESENKYLNIIDLVGNHKESYQRILGLSGKKTINPREAIKKTLSSEYEIDDVAKEEILNKICKKMKYEKYFYDKLSDENLMYKYFPKTKELENYFKEELGIIINNFRSNNEYSLENSKPWIINYKERLNFKFNKITKKEMGLIELFSWLPLTITTPKIKGIIFSLMNGSFVELPKIWKDYFYGPRNKWSLVKGDYEKFFEEKESKVAFKLNLNFTDEFIELFNEVKELLESRLNKNDYMKIKWYSRQEINFMAGKVIRSQDAFVKSAKNEIFITNIIDNLKSKKSYTNRASSNYEYLISSNTKFKYENPDKIKYHNFMGRRMFHKYTMYLYVGDQKSLIPIKMETDYPTYNFTSNLKIKDDDLIMLTNGI